MRAALAPFVETSLSRNGRGVDLDEILGEPLEPHFTELDRIGAGREVGYLAEFRDGGELRDLGTNFVGEPHDVADLERGLVEEFFQVVHQQAKRNAVAFADLFDGLRLADRAIRAAAEVEAREHATSAGMRLERLLDG